MTNKIEPREWEALSAYLDGQLASGERLRLEARLEQEAALRTAYEDLQQMQRVLRAQKVRAPRNFTLTREMVGAGSKPSLWSGPFPWLHLTSALAGVLLVFVLITDLFTAAPAVPAMPYWVQPPLSAQEQAAMEAAPPGMGGEVPTAKMMEGEAPDMGLQAMEAPAETEAPAAALADQPAPEAEVEAFSAPAEASSAPEDLAMAAPMMEGRGGESELGAAPMPTANTAPGLDPMLLRTAEVTLALLALGAGLAAYWVRRNP